MKTNSKMVPGKSRQFILRVVFVFLLISVANALSEEQKPPSKPHVEISPAQAEIPYSKIFFGRWTEKITNPYCINMGELTKNTAEYKEVQKQKMRQNTAKYWILMAHANDVVRQQIIDFANAKHIEFICDRERLFPILRRQQEFNGKSEAELITQFDLTKPIMKFADKLGQLIAEKRKSGKGLGRDDKASSMFIKHMDPENPINKTDSEIIAQFDLINKAAETISIPEN